MIELNLNAEEVRAWFAREQEGPYALVRVTDEAVLRWLESLSLAVRRCYLTDDTINEHAARLAIPASELIAARIPDRGSTMAGDFGEILTFLYLGTATPAVSPLGPKKWRLKQDRTKPAPYSDVVHFLLPNWPDSSAADRIICAEVKTKATAGASTPITSAILDSNKDRTSRLAKTLVWLKERALFENLGSVTIQHIDRFQQAIDHPPALKEFYAVAVICGSLVDGELAEAPDERPNDYALLIIVVPNLQEEYHRVFERLTQVQAG